MSPGRLGRGAAGPQRASALVLLAALLVLPAPVAAFWAGQAKWTVPSGGVPHCLLVNARQVTTTIVRQQFAGAVANSVGAWNDVPCSYYRGVAGACPGTALSSNDGWNWIFWEQDWQAVPGVDSTTLGVTLLWMLGNQIVDADILLNDQDVNWDTAGEYTDVQSIVTHEYGHFLGLRHPDEIDDPPGIAADCNNGGSLPAVMCAYYQGGLVRELTADDIGGACFLYPVPGAIGSSCTQDASCSGGICYTAGLVDYCTHTCAGDGDCEPGFSCLDSSRGRICQPRQAIVPDCTPCGPMTCGPQSYCLGAQGQAGSTYCSTPCVDNYDCLPGFTCAGLTGGGGACWPAGNSCRSSADGPGSDCLADNSCSLGNVCLYTNPQYTAAACFRLCRTGGDCPPGQGCVSLAVGLGYCDHSATGPCGCDLDSNCNLGCVCDPDCMRCGCDQDWPCEKDCACDGECCACNVSQRCDPACPCDPDCGCACDSGGGCQGACYCDVDCQSADTCPCDRNPGCTSGCACDADCPCACDEYYDCEDDCPCDPDCYCACDLYEACEEGCDCDPDCGCGCAAPGSVSGGHGAPAALVFGLGYALVVLGASAARRRRPA